MRFMLLVMLCLNWDPPRRSVSMVSRTCPTSASMVASWILRERMDGSAGVVVEPAVEPVAAAADAILAVSSWTEPGRVQQCSASRCSSSLIRWMRGPS